MQEVNNTNGISYLLLMRIPNKDKNNNNNVCSPNLELLYISLSNAFRSILLLNLSTL